MKVSLSYLSSCSPGVKDTEFKLEIICSSIELSIIDLFISFIETSDSVKEQSELTTTDSSSLNVTFLEFLDF